MAIRCARLLQAQARCWLPGPHRPWTRAGAVTGRLGGLQGRTLPGAGRRAGHLGILSQPPLGPRRGSAREGGRPMQNKPEYPRVRRPGRVPTEADARARIDRAPEPCHLACSPQQSRCWTHSISSKLPGSREAQVRDGVLDELTRTACPPSCCSPLDIRGVQGARSAYAAANRILFQALTHHPAGGRPV